MKRVIAIGLGCFLLAGCAVSADDGDGDGEEDGDEAPVAEAVQAATFDDVKSDMSRPSLDVVKYGIGLKLGCSSCRPGKSFCDLKPMGPTLQK